MKIGVAYFANRILRHVKADMQKLKRLGFDFVVHTFSEFDFQFHHCNLQDIVKVSQDCGLEVYLDPWGVGNFFGGEPFSDFVTKHYRDGCQVLENGEPVFLACPNSSAFQNYMTEWTQAAIVMNPSGIFWDEPHFNSPDYLKGIKGHWSCRCSFCQQKFQDLFHHEMPLIENEEVRTFKQNSLVSFIQQLGRLVRNACMKNILFLTANLPPQQAEKDWQTFAQMIEIDSLSTGYYWTFAGTKVEDTTAYALILRELCEVSNKEPLYWIQNIKIESGREKEIELAIELVYTSGIRNFAIWGFESGSHESWLACDNPQRAWRLTLKKFQQLKAQQ